MAQLLHDELPTQIENDFASKKDAGGMVGHSHPSIEVRVMFG